MNALNDAIDELERTTRMLEQVLREHLDAMRRERENFDAQTANVEVLTSEKLQLAQENVRLRALIAHFQHRAQENGDRILHATQKIRATLGKS